MSTFSKVALFAFLAVSSVQAAPVSSGNSTAITATKEGGPTKANVPGIHNWGNLGLHDVPTLQAFQVDNKNASAHLSSDIKEGIIAAQNLESKDAEDKKELADVQKQEKALKDKENKLKADEKKTAGKAKDAKHHVAGLIEQFKAKHNVPLKHLIMPAIKEKNTTTVVKKVYEHMKTSKVVDTKNKNGTHSYTVTKESEEFKEIMTSTTHGIIAGKLGQPESILISTTETEDKKVAADGSYTLSFSYVTVTKVADVSSPKNGTSTHDIHDTKKVTKENKKIEEKKPKF